MLAHHIILLCVTYNSFFSSYSIRNLDKDYVKPFFENGGKIEIFQFYGRRRYGVIQLPFLLQNMRIRTGGYNHLKLVSVVNLFLNTNNLKDLEFAKFISHRYPEYFVS